MNTIVKMNIAQFSLIYLLLIIILVIMKKARVNQTKLLVVASFRMSVQLVLAGFVLTWIFENPHPLLTVAYIVSMVIFAIHRVISRCKRLNRTFKIIVACSLAGTGVSLVAYFVAVVVGINVFNPQYTIPISGMIIANSMNGVALGLRSFTENIRANTARMDALINAGVTPKKILLPFVNDALETALIPTLNSMVGMGIISLPGMMTGQILSGTLPMTAILYQIAIMIAICTAVCVTVFTSLYLGYRTMYNKRYQIQVS
ncbi:MAG TPA: iron export ABC transporter permease subunit FetB [Treponemataceae bacterium]|jgi:putative ABC transport system permease protein|nr:iron export ABC transporter permease subunit FetB [Treponemataceae bacterium]HRR02785.1 iron export ABC transporter permease subunit FetB [Treponemataceae bacterium]